MAVTPTTALPMPRLQRGRSPLFLVLLTAFFAGRVLNGQEAKRGEIPRRIVAIAPNTAEMICAIGACDAIVGVSKFCVFPPELKSRPQVGGLYDPDLEGILALRPDLLVTRGHHDALIRIAEQGNFRIYHDETDSISGIKRTVLELGTMLGRDKQAQDVVTEFQGRLDAIRQANQSKPKPRVLITVSRNPERLSNILTAGRGTFLTEMIEIAGGVNVFGTLDMRYPEVSVESIIAEQPDCIIELMPDVDVIAQDQKLRQQWADLPSIPAVAANRVYFLTADNALIPSTRFANLVEEVARILHPPGTGK